MNNLMDNEQDEFLMNDDRWITDCCGAPIRGEICSSDEKNSRIGLCSRCLEWSGVTKNLEYGS